MIGPYARLRGSVIDEKAKVGNFVEVKNAHVGKGRKRAILPTSVTRILAPEANVGAGTITCK